jgi:hypothetical protein
MPNKAKTKPVHLKRKDVEPDPYLSRNEFKPEFYSQPSQPSITYETLKGTAAKPIPNVTDTEYFKTGGVAAMDESMAHENKESKKQEAKETKLEKKGYIETKAGKMKKVKKAYTGKAIRQPTETSNEFKIRHEYHTPFKEPQKAKTGVMMKNVSKKISTENTDDEYYPTGEGKEYPGGFMPEIRGTMPEGFKSPMEIKKGGLIKGKPRIAMKGWK